jgi:hypothetical protein
LGEIKSTLELIMEKTRDMVPSEEEKQAFRAQEVEVEVRGLVQKYLDSALDLEKLREELERFKGEDRQTAQRSLVRECAARLDPEEDPAPLIDLMKSAAGVDPSPYLERLKRCRERLDREAEKAAQRVLERIKRKGISGDAIRPNIRSDEEWTALLESQRASLKEELEKLAQGGY